MQPCCPAVASCSKRSRLRSADARRPDVACGHPALIFLKLVASCAGRQVQRQSPKVRLLMSSPRLVGSSRRCFSQAHYQQAQTAHNLSHSIASTSTVCSAPPSSEAHDASLNLALAWPSLPSAHTFAAPSSHHESQHQQRELQQYDAMRALQGSDRRRSLVAFWTC